MIDPNVNPGAVVRAVTETCTRLKQERVDKETIWEECWLAYCSKSKRSRIFFHPFPIITDTIVNDVIHKLVKHYTGCFRPHHFRIKDNVACFLVLVKTHLAKTQTQSTPIQE